MTSHGVTRITLVPYTYLEQLQRTVRGAGSPDQHGIRSHLTLTPFDRLLARLLCLLVNWVELKATCRGIRHVNGIRLVDGIKHVDGIRHVNGIWHMNGNWHVDGIRITSSVQQSLTGFRRGSEGIRMRDRAPVEDGRIP